MMRREASSSSRRASSIYGQVALLAVFALLTAIYVILRFRGLWGEVDTASAGQYIRAMADSGTLIPSQNVYPNGYGYQALGVFLMNISGLSIQELQIFGSALLIAWLIWPAWLLYRELTESSSAATLATVLFFVQPEFLFGVLRGTHEKFTRGLMLLCLYLLFRSLRSRQRPAFFASCVLAFYLVIYAAIAFNNLLAISFIQATLLALLLSGVMVSRRYWPHTLSRPTLWRLGYVLSASLLLAYMFTFYAYKPAEHDLLILQSVVDRVSALFLDVSAEATNPYAQWVASAWISTPVYLVMTLANWLLLFASAAIWLAQGLGWLRRRRQPTGETEVLLWAFYGAFAMLGAVSILADVSGVLAGNLQHRMFPSFAMLAAPLVARWLVGHLSGSETRRRVAYAGLAGGIACLAILSILKATNEPLLSNKWLFYQPGEMAALDWADTKLPDRVLWTGFDDRLLSAAIIRNGGQDGQARLTAYAVSPGTENFLVTDLMREQGERLRREAPIAADDLRVFDGGSEQIFHRRPQSPYQR